MHMTFILTIVIYLAKKTLVALLLVEKMQIPTKYSDFLDVFLQKKASILSKVTKINQHAIKLEKVSN